MFTDEMKNEIRAKIDIVQYLENNGVTMSVSGINYKGLCPFHNERSPSFHVRPLHQRYHCFGCGEGGDVFDLAMHFESLSFVGAVQMLAEKAGVKISTPEQDEHYNKVRRIQQMNVIAAEFFHENFLKLPDVHPAKQNLAKRGLLEYALTDQSVGFAPNGELIRLLNSHRFATDEIVEAGLAKRYENEGRYGSTQNVGEVFRNRLMWTIYDVGGKPVGFSGRVVFEADEARAPKYVNTPATLVYNKSKVLLGLSAARKPIIDSGSVVVVEGQTDVMAYQAAGVKNVVASCGTAFGKEHATMLSRLADIGVRKGNSQFKYLFCFDADAAGLKAAISTFTNIPEIQLNSYVITLEDEEQGYDPCDYRHKYGDERLARTITEPIPMVEFILQNEKTRWDLRTPEGRSGFVNACRPTLAIVQDRLQYDSYLRKIAFWSGIPFSSLVDALNGNQRGLRQQAAPAVNPETSTALNLDVEDRVKAAILQHPELMGQAMMTSGIKLEMFRDPNATREFMETMPAASPLAFHDLRIIDGNETEALERLCQSFLQVKYAEQKQLLDVRIAAMSSEDAATDDMNLFAEILQEQADLKARYKQK